jgi:CheY-like chemotaxis protein
MRNSKPILLVEDDDVDALTTKRALTEIKVTNDIVHTFDGEEAVAYLKNGKPKPCVILLDLNMPKMNGFEFLRIIKADENLRNIPVIILTTSDTDQNVLDSYKLGVAGYITKPVNYRQFVDTMRTVDMYWTLSKLPENDQ